MIAKILISRIVISLAMITTIIGLIAIPAVSASATSSSVTIPTITITFDPCNGEPQILIQTKAGNSFPMPQIPERTGYTFKGWFTERDGGGREFTQPAMNDMTIYANWEINKYIIGFNANMQDLHWSRTYDNYPDDWFNRQTHGSIIEMPPPYSLNGYDFIGWNTARDGSGQFINTDLIITAQLHLYAQWQVRMCTVNLCDWDGSFYSQTSIPYGEQLNYPTHPERPGYRFINWQDTIVIYEDCTLTARYELIPITFKPGCGYIKDYDNSVISNIPYGTTQRQLIANLQNEPNMMQLTNFNNILITDPNAILHTGHRIQMVVDGQLYENYALRITDDPAPERPAGPIYDNMPWPNSSVTPKPAVQVTVPGSSVPIPSPTTGSTSPTPTPEQTTTISDKADETQPATQPGGQAPPPGGTPGITTVIIVIISAAGSIGMLGILAVLQRRRLPKPPMIQPDVANIPGGD